MAGAYPHMGVLFFRRCLFMFFITLLVIAMSKPYVIITERSDGIRSHQSSQQSHLRAISKPWMFRCPR